MEDPDHNPYRFPTPGEPISVRMPTRSGSGGEGGGDRRPNPG